MIANARTWTLASAVAALALPSAALAQYGEPTPPPAQSTGPHGEAVHGSGQPAAAPAAPASASQVTAGAACVIGHNATAGDAILATSPYSAAERTQATRMLSEMRRCTHQQPMVTSAATVRGAFAEAAVETVFPTAPAARTPAIGAAPLLRPTEGDPAFNAQVGPMYQLADCATPRQPDLARAVLATEPGTPAESTAISALNPTYVACVPAGSRISIDPRLMRYMLAEALYRWSVVQRDGPTSPMAAAAAPAAAGH